MRDRTVNRVESWDARPFSGGFETLREMADAGFSGVAVSGDAWLFMLNGRVVGIVDGDIDDFEDASGTVYEAPDPSLPLLFSMQERGGQTQAKYYTNDTPLTDADDTLSNANFTGYVELSENVLSGDYYLVYYGGRALPVAFVGVSEELKTGDEAYDLAADEVGVYEVIKTPVQVTEVPEPAESPDDEDAAAGAVETQSDSKPSSSAAGSTAGAAAGAAASSDANDEPDTGSTRPTTTGAGETDTAERGGSDVIESAGETSTVEPDGAARDAAKSRESSADVGDSDDATDSDSTSDVTEAEPERDRSIASERETRGSDAHADSADAPTDSASDQASSARLDDEADAATNGGADSGTVTDQESGQRTVFSEEEQWRKTKSIPSLTPSEREKRLREQKEAAESKTQAEPAGARSEQGTKSARTNAAGTQQPETEPADEPSPAASPAESEPEPESAAPSQPDAAAPAESGATTDDPEPSAEAAAQVTELETRLEAVEAERDDLAESLAAVEQERDDLARRVSQLEDALEDAGGESTPGPSLTPDEALAGTNLFVRYGSKGKPTLDELAGNNPDREAIDKNLQIDHHTQFEATDASVDGAAFEDYLTGTSAYRFVSWVVRDLPYEILDSGHRTGMSDLYDVLPDIDRAELQGEVEVETENGTEHRSFDVVLRDRMGNPLIVAELNDERDPVSGDEMASLVDAAQVVGEGTESLGSAFYVTASFFEPVALENAADATASGGILSRGDKESYVKLGRKQGFHLCLAEDRNESFHLTVPEL